jgi:hypothetical protein
VIRCPGPAGGLPIRASAPRTVFREIPSTRAISEIDIFSDRRNRRISASPPRSTPTSSLARWEPESSGDQYSGAAPCSVSDAVDIRTLFAALVVLAISSVRWVPLRRLNHPARTSLRRMAWYEWQILSPRPGHRACLALSGLLPGHGHPHLGVGVGDQVAGQVDGVLRDRPRRGRTF